LVRSYVRGIPWGKGNYLERNPSAESRIPDDLESPAGNTLRDVYGKSLPGLLVSLQEGGDRSGTGLAEQTQVQEVRVAIHDE
jgi:hypothetical protein